MLGRKRPAAALPPGHPQRRRTDGVVPGRPKPWVCDPTSLHCQNGHPYDDRRVTGARHSLHFRGMGHVYLRCRCGACAFGVSAITPHGDIVVLYACHPDDLKLVEDTMRGASTADILTRLGYKVHHPEPKDETHG